MARPRVQDGRNGVKVGLDQDPTHLRYAAVLRDLLWWHCAELARVTPFCERDLQRWMNPRGSSRRSPLEDTQALIAGMLEIGVEDALRPLAMLAADFGCDLFDGSAPATDGLVPLVSCVAKALAEMGEAAQKAIEVADPESPDGGGVSEAELAEAEREIQDVIEALHLLRRQLQARAGRVVDIKTASRG